MAIWQFDCNIIPIRDNMDTLSQEETGIFKDISGEVIVFC